MKTPRSLLNDIIFSSKYWYYTENIIVVGLFWYCIKHLLDYNEELYQVWKNEAGAKAIIAFTGIIFIIRKVKLINWQSLFASIIMILIAIERYHALIESPALFSTVKYQLVAEWITILVIIDMLLYKNVNDLFSNNTYLLIMYAFLTMGALYRRHDQMGPIILVFPMFLFALLKMDDEKKIWFLHRFFDGWFISFVYVCIRSFRETPYIGEQYYGYFQMPGPFSIFIICCLTVAIVSFIYSIKQYGFLCFASFASLLWIIACSYMIWIIGTRTSLLGVFFMLIFLYIFACKDISKKKIIRRSLIICLSVLLILIIGFFLPQICSIIPVEWVEKNAVGPLSPIALDISRFQWMKSATVGNTFKQTLYVYIDLFSSSRISIIREYAKYFNFDGNGPIGITVDNLDSYYAYSAHNTYVQFLVEYGYITFVELMTLIVITLNKGTKKYIKEGQQAADLLPILWIVSMLGVWFGESETFFYPVTFFGFMFIASFLPPSNTIKRK